MVKLAVKEVSAAAPPVFARVVSGVVAALLGVGALGFLAALSGVALGVAAQVAGLAAAVVVAAAGAFAADMPRAGLRLPLACVAVLAIVLVALGTQVMAGGAVLVDGFLVKVGARTQEYALPLVEGGQAECALFMMLLGVLVGMFCGPVARHGRVGAAVALALAALAGLASGWAGAGWWAVALALGVAGVVVVRSLSLGASGRGGRPAWLGAFAFLGMACLVAAAVAAGAVRGPVADTQEAAMRLDAAAASLAGDGGHAMPGGDLRALGKLEAGDQTALVVRAEGPVREYLRGFVGERLEGDRWQPLDAGDVMGARDLFYRLERDGFSAASQLGDAAEACGFDGASRGSIEIDYAGAPGPYAYLPYMCSGSQAGEVTDLSQTRRLSGGTLVAECETGITQQAYLLQEALVSAREGDGAREPALEAYLRDEGAYRQFVHESYLDVPEQTAATFEQLVGEARGLDPEQAKMVVRSVLANMVTCDPQLAPVKDDARAAEKRREIKAEDAGKLDFTTRFLVFDRVGYSVHYATAATLMMRYFGVPARYVEGYVLDTEAETTGYGDGVSPVETTGYGDGVREHALTERGAHAWVEYYLDGVGWVPFDVTPGWGDEGFYQATDNVETVDESQVESVGESARYASWTPPEQADDVEPDVPEDDKPAIWLFALDWPWVLAGFVVALLAAFAVRDALLHARLRRFVERCERGERADGCPDWNAATSDLFAYLVLLARECGGVAFGRAPFGQQADAVEQAGLCTGDSFARACCANDVALFSRQGAGPDDVAAVAACVREVRAGLCALPAGRRFYQRHFRCDW